MSIAKIINNIFRSNYCNVYSSQFQCHLEEPEEDHWPWLGCATRRGSPCPGWWSRSAGTLCSSPPTAAGSCGPAAPAPPGDRACSCHGIVMVLSFCHVMSWWHSADLAAAAWYCWAGGCRNLMTVPTMSRVTRRSRSMGRQRGPSPGDGDGVFVWTLFCYVDTFLVLSIFLSVILSAAMLLPCCYKIQMSSSSVQFSNI